MNCAACKYYSMTCIKDCLQIYFKNDPTYPERFPVKIHKSEVGCIEIGSVFLSVTDTDGVQHNYNLDTITHFHIPNFEKK